MRTYVTSAELAGRYSHGRLAHIGDGTWTACGYIVSAPFTITPECPPYREVCPRCASRYVRQARPRPPVRRRRDDMVPRVVALLCEGMTQREVADELRIGLRSVARYVNDARAESGAKTLFQWGYLLGRAARD